MALNIFKCNHLTTLQFKGLKHALQSAARFTQVAVVHVCPLHLDKSWTRLSIVHNVQSTLGQLSYTYTQT